MLPMGKALMGFAAACFLLVWDPSKIAMRYGFALCLGAFLAAALVNYWREPRALKISRQLPDRVFEGSMFDYVVSVTNHGKRASPSLACRDHGRLRFPSARDWLRAPAPFDAELNRFDRWIGYPKWLWLVESLQDVVGADFEIPALAPGQTVLIPAHGRAGQRGLRIFVGFYCGLPDPFALLQRLFFIRSKQTLLVLPKPLRSGIGVPVGSRSISAGESRDLRNIGDSEEFRSLREWRSGDAMKRIDWKATARTMAPVAREYAPEFKLRTALAFDTSLPDAVDEQAFEDAIGYAAGLAISMDRKERNIDLLLVEKDRVSLREGASTQSQVLALERLASCSPSGSGSLNDLEESIMAAAPHFSSVLLVCPTWTENHAALAARLTLHGIGLAILVSSGHVCAGFPPAATVQLFGGTCP